MIRWSASVAFCALLLLSGCAGSQPTLVDVAHPTVATTPEPVLRPDGAEGAPEEFAFLDDTVVGADPPVLRVGVVGTPPTDPLNASVVEPSHMLKLDLLYDGLTEWDTASESWRLGLATDADVSEDGLVWTFDLGTKAFSDGTPITASDVVRSLQRWKAAPDALAASRLDVIASIEASGAESVVITLQRPFALLPGLLSSPVYGVVPEGRLDGGVGSGPALGPPPAVSVEIASFGTETQALEAFERQDVDLIYVDAAYAGDVDLTVDSSVETYLVANADAASLADVVQRRELFAAVDSRPVAHAGYGNAATPIRRLDGDPAGCDDVCGGSGLVEGLGTVSLSYVHDADQREAVMAEVIAGQMRAAGVPQVTLRSYSVEELVGEIADSDHELVRSGWVGLFPSDDSRLSPFQSQSAENIAGYQSKAFDSALAEAQLSGSAELYAKARQILEVDAVVLGLARLQIRAKVGPRVLSLGLRHDGSIDLARLVLAS